MPVGERADGEGAEHQPEESGGEQRPELRDSQLPFRANRGCDEPDDRRVETVDGDDEEAQDEQQPLQRRYRMFVDERLNVDDAGPAASVVANVFLAPVGHFRQQPYQRLRLGSGQGCEQPVLHAANARLHLMQGLLTGG